MKDQLVIALDAMGGDNAPEIVVEGANLALKNYPKVRFIFFGDEKRVLPLVEQCPKLKKVSEVRHTDQAVLNEDKPSVALRKKRQSSMRLAINAVDSGEAHCVVSAGNTGALMTMAKFVLKTLPGIDRPAIATYMPTIKGRSVMLDLGANIECSPRNLIQFALMGGVFSRAYLGVERPTIGLLNIGSEEMKGNESLKEAAQMLKDTPLEHADFHGFVEGDDIAKGTVDVVVTDGFTGNVALKTIEGTAKLIKHFMSEAFKTSLLARIGGLFSLGALRKLRQSLDPRKYNGAMFLGLRGVCVKSHGGTDGEGFANAIGVAHDLVKFGFNEKITEEVELLNSAEKMHSAEDDKAE